MWKSYWTWEEHFSKQLPVMHNQMCLLALELLSSSKNVLLRNSRKTWHVFIMETCSFFVQNPYVLDMEGNVLIPRTSSSPNFKPNLSKNMPGLSVLTSIHTVSAYNQPKIWGKPSLENWKVSSPHRNSLIWWIESVFLILTMLQVWALIFM